MVFYWFYILQFQHIDFYFSITKIQESQSSTLFEEYSRYPLYDAINIFNYYIPLCYEVRDATLNRQHYYISWFVSICLTLPQESLFFVFFKSNELFSNDEY